jgi:hypothetical protein
MTEKKRLEAQRLGTEDWRLWGPYLSERAWGTVREDYSPDGEAWHFFDHDQACSRAYRWNEDGIGGICDAGQRLCLAVSLWNGRDPILKERLFGLTNAQGNHGEDVKECFFYLDATPSHSCLRFLYKYPQAAFPYVSLVEENRRRSRSDPPFGILDTDVFQENRYWDVEVAYAKQTAEVIFIRVRVSNRGPETATLHILPTLWFRNTWSWQESGQEEKPELRLADPGMAAWAVTARHGSLGRYVLYGRQEADIVFTENDSNLERLFGVANPAPYVKDAFHRLVVEGEQEAVNPARIGTKCAAWHEVTCAAGAETTVELVLTAHAVTAPFAGAEEVWRRRREEADDPFIGIWFPTPRMKTPWCFRQAMAGMIWCKQFYHFDVGRWLDGDLIPPPEERSGPQQGLAAPAGRGRHLHAGQLGISVVCGLGPGLPLHGVCPSGRRFCQGAGRAAPEPPLPASQRPDSRPTNGPSMMSTHRCMP